MIIRFCSHAQEIPQGILKDCRSHLIEPTELPNPLKNIRFRIGVPKVYRFFENAIKDEGLPKERTVTSVSHGTFALQIHGAPILRKFYEDPDQNVKLMFFARLARVPSVLRMV